jgi:hypothetical protein
MNELVKTIDERNKQIKEEEEFDETAFIEKIQNNIKKREFFST